MCANSTPASPYLAQWSWLIDGGPPDVAVVRDAARATARNWGLGALADDVALMVAEFSSSAWTHGDLPITVRLWLQDGVVTIEVSDAGPGLTLFSGSRPLGTGGRGSPPLPPSPRRWDSTAEPSRRRCGHGCTSDGYLPKPSPEPYRE
jgi:hypothetical protein